MCKRLWVLALVMSIGAASAGADTVVLTNGGRLDGIVTEKGDRIRVETEYGAMEVARDMVYKILPGPTKLDAYRKRAAALADEDVAGHFALGQWAKANELDKMARAEFERVLALEPNHEGARLQLGYEKVEDRWLNRDEAMRARGFVQVDGQWITKEENDMRVALAREAELRAEVRRAEEREQRRQEQLARLEALEDARLAALEEQNRRLREEYERRAAASVYGGYGYGYGYPAVYSGYGYAPYTRAVQTVSIADPYGALYTDQTGQVVTLSRDPATGALVWNTSTGTLHTDGDGHSTIYDSMTGRYLHYTVDPVTKSSTPDLVLTPIPPATTTASYPMPVVPGRVLYPTYGYPWYGYGYPYSATRDASGLYVGGVIRIR